MLNHRNNVIFKNYTGTTVYMKTYQQIIIYNKKSNIFFQDNNTGTIQQNRTKKPAKPQ